MLDASVFTPLSQYNPLLGHVSTGFVHPIVLAKKVKHGQIGTAIFYRFSIGSITTLQHFCS